LKFKKADIHTPRGSGIIYAGNEIQEKQMLGFIHTIRFEELLKSVEGNNV